jgi:hypothetical protein
VEVDLKTLCEAAALFVVMLLGDFRVWVGEIMLWGDSLVQVTVTAANPTVCECRFCLGKR